MTSCKYCHTDHILDAKGRCSSCADVGDAARAGMHYGDYIASRDAAHLRPIPLPVPKPEPVSRANAIKTCRICGALIPPESPRRTLCSLECQAEFNRQSASAAHARKKAAQAAKEKPVRYCAICGEPLPSNMRKYCTPECAHIGALKNERESKKRRAERMKNYDKL